MTTKEAKTTKTVKPSKTTKKAISTKKTAKKSQKVEPDTVELSKSDSGQPLPEAPGAPSTSIDDAKNASMTAPESEVRINLSSKLRKKLAEQAEDEGISLSDYLEELLAEASVIRAWELVEKKLHMRGGQNQGSQGNHNPRNNRNNQGRNKTQNGHGNGNGNGHGNANRRNMNNARYQNLMEDKASFLEYVRNQERNNNR